MKNGDQIQIELKDATGAVIAGQSVMISYADGSGNVQNYSIVTDQTDRGFLTLSGEEAGSYEVTVTYGGNDMYNGCVGKQTITIEEGTSDSQASVSENATASTVMYNNGSSSSSSSASSGSSSDSVATSSNGDKAFSHLYYDEELGVYYDDFGTVRGGDMDGNDVSVLRELKAHPNTDEYGNPQ